MKLKLIYSLLFGLCASCLTGCGDDDDNDSQPNVPNTPTTVTQTTRVFSFSRSNSWSCVAYKDVTLAEIHAEVSNFKLLCNPPEGYNVSLQTLPQKDEAGYTVYRIVCDMAAISATTTDNKNDQLSFPYTLEGTKTTNGQEYKVESKGTLGLQRFLCPEVDSDTLLKLWYLAEHDVNENSDWVTFQSEDKYTDLKSVSTSYTLSDTPLRNWSDLVLEYTNEKGETIKQTQREIGWSCKLELPGWVKGTVPVNTTLNDSRITFTNYPADFGSSVYLVTDQVMWTMKAEYSETGDLLRVHRYKFIHHTEEE